MTFINSYIPHSNIYWFTAENRIKSNLQDLGIFRHQIYMVAMVTQSSALRQLNNKSPTIYNYNLLNDILFGFSFRTIFPKKYQAFFHLIYFGKKITLNIFFQQMENYVHFCQLKTLIEIDFHAPITKIQWFTTENKIQSKYRDTTFLSKLYLAVNHCLFQTGTQKIMTVIAFIFQNGMNIFSF